jgi:hypothetical protein
LKETVSPGSKSSRTTTKPSRTLSPSSRSRGLVMMVLPLEVEPGIIARRAAVHSGRVLLANWGS